MTINLHQAPQDAEDASVFLRSLGLASAEAERSPIKPVAVAAAAAAAALFLFHWPRYLGPTAPAMGLPPHFPYQNEAR